MTDYFELAAGLARETWASAPTTIVTCPIWIHEPTNMTCEHVFPRCTADEFEPGVLTITCQDKGAINPIRVFQANAWRRAVVRGENGYTDFTFINETGDAHACDSPVTGPDRTVVTA